VIPDIGAIKAYKQAFCSDFRNPYAFAIQIVCFRKIFMEALS
jgi:hypothetical protein